MLSFYIYFFYLCVRSVIKNLTNKYGNPNITTRIVERIVFSNQNNVIQRRYGMTSDPPGHGFSELVTATGESMTNIPTDSLYLNTLPAHPRPQALESLNSYLKRLAQANGIHHLATFSHLTDIAQPECLLELNSPST
jgi:hypothetical protein